MKRSKLLGLAFMAILALTSTATATASAESLPNILPCGTEALPVTSISESGESTFGSGLTSVTSTSSLGTLSSNGEGNCKLGLFHTSFLNVKTSLGTLCEGLGDVDGIVLVLGKYHIRDAKEGANLITVMAFLLEKVHFLCGSLLILVEGCVAGKLSPPNELTTLLETNLEVEGKDNKIITILNEANTAEEACQLLAALNEGNTELSSQKTKQFGSKFIQNSAEVKVLVMPL